MSAISHRRFAAGAIPRASRVRTVGTSVEDSLEQVDHRHWWLPATLPKYSDETQMRERERGRDRA